MNNFEEFVQSRRNSASTKQPEIFEPTIGLRFEKRKVNKLNADGTQKYFRILQQLFKNNSGDEIWQDIPVVERFD